jgi:hypothetical protein
MESITIENKQNFWDLLRLRFYLHYLGQPVIYICLILGLLFVFDENAHGLQIVVGYFLIFTFPLLLLKQVYGYAARNNKTPIIFTFTSEKIHMTSGEYIKSDIYWKGVAKIIELKRWYLLYVNKRVAYSIPKKNFTAEQLNAFHEMILNVEVPKKKLHA